MNNTKKTTTLAIVAIFMAATLVVGTLAATTTATQSAFAYSQKKDDNKKDGGNNNGNTVTVQKCKQAATQSGFDNNQGQECENLICTHPGENATCTQEGATISTPTTSTPQPITTTLRIIKTVVCLPTDPNCSLPDICDISVIIGSSRQTFTCQSAVGNGILLTLQPGEQFNVGFTEVFNPGGPTFDVSRSGDCSALKGTIAEGQHLTCTITNTETS